MDRPSLKKEIIGTISAATSMVELKGNSVVLIASAGMITGSFPQEDSVAKESAFSEMVGKVADRYKETYGIDSLVPGSDGYIILDDVSIRNGASNIHMPQLVVFHDQIIGITLGTTD